MIKKLVVKDNEDISKNLPFFKYYCGIVWPRVMAIKKMLSYSACAVIVIFPRLTLEKFDHLPPILRKFKKTEKLRYL